ncbi:hypothetical protein HY634_03250 [Candidatus Uhrbacteria bacterium]|nr:hypothetical protein [Candidatus Uhrbacteria bacterium]
MARTAKHPRRRVTRRERKQTTTTPKRRRAAPRTVEPDEELATLDNEFAHSDDWLEPYEPNEEAT